MACRFETCCCCIELRLGCFIIGYLDLIHGSVYAGLYIAALIFGGDAVKYIKDTELDDFGTVETIDFVVLTIAYVLYVIVSIVLLAGLYKNKPSYLKAYVKFNILIIALVILCFLINMSQTGFNSNQLIAVIISVVFALYFLFVVRSYSLKMEEENYAKQNYSVSYRANV